MRIIENIDVSVDYAKLFNTHLSKIQNNGIEAEVSQIEVVWKNLGGTLNADFNIYQVSQYSEILITTINISSANGGKIFILNNYENIIKIEYLANLVASGELKFIIYWKEKCK